MTEINNIEEVKKILEHYFSEELGEGASNDIADEICQLFPQPLDEGLKVLVDGEWVEASKELKDTVRSIEQTLPDKKLREQIAKILYYTSGEVRAWEDIFEITKDMWGREAAQILALLQPKIGEARRQEKINTLRELRDMWAYEQASGRAVMAVRLDKWIEYCRDAGIKDDWWELKEE